MGWIHALRDIIGTKATAAATGAVTETDQMMAYVKQLVTQQNAQDNVIGTVATAAATGAVTATDLLMAYVKQLVTEGIARDAVIGAVDTTAATGAVTATDMLMAYVKQLVTELQVVDEYHDVPAADNVLNAQINEVIGNKTDAAATGAVTTTDTLVAYIKQLVTNSLTIANGTLPADPTANSLAAFIASGGTALGAELADSKSIVNALGFDGSAFVAGGLGMYLPRCVEKANGAVLTGADDLFTITGGPVRCKLFGHVTTIIGGAATAKLQHTTTDPAATVDLSAAAVAIDDDAVGTVYYSVGATAVFTPGTSLGVAKLDPVTVEEVEFILAPGTVKFTCSAAQSGVVKWYMTYWPLSPSSVVAAAA